MKTEKDEAALFREECLRWQDAFGLKDWTLHITAEPATQGQTFEAETDYDCDTRHAKVVYYVGVEDALHPRDVAYHEIVHLLFADMLLLAIAARDESDPLLAREEHRVIERMIKARGIK